MSSNEVDAITDSERLAALKKYLVVVDIDAYECDALLTIGDEHHKCGLIYFQSEDDFSVNAALDYLVMEERKRNA